MRAWKAREQGLPETRTVTKIEEVKQVHSRAIEQLGQVLERAHGKTPRESFAAMALFHRYRLHNVIMISYGLNATRR
jgi:hypothetical protein